MMGLKRRALPLFVMFIAPSSWARTAAPAAVSPEAQVDNIFEKMDKTVSPGCALSVMKDGKIIYERGYGMADLDHNVPVTTGPWRLWIMPVPMPDTGRI
jgi:CubicO group peptidase (beta-lactamase class C family)